MIDVDGPNARVAAAVATSGVKPQIKILETEARTAAAAAAQLGFEVGAIANSLVFDCDGEPLLVMSSGAHRVDTTLLAGVLGAYQIRKASPQLVRSATGQVIGEVHRLAIPAGCGPLSMSHWHGIR